MAFQEDPQQITWRLHLTSSPAEVYRFLSTDVGRSRFWAESTNEDRGHVSFQFPDGQNWTGAIIEARSGQVFEIEYFGSLARFLLESDGKDGTDLTLIDKGVDLPNRQEVIAGWVSVLLALKGAVDFGIDLRNHDPQRTWAQGYLDN